MNKAIFFLLVVSSIGAYAAIDLHTTTRYRGAEQPKQFELDKERNGLIVALTDDVNMELMLDAEREDGQVLRWAAVAGDGTVLARDITCAHWDRQESISVVDADGIEIVFEFTVHKKVDGNEATERHSSS